MPSHIFIYQYEGKIIFKKISLLKLKTNMCRYHIEALTSKTLPIFRTNIQEIGAAALQITGKDFPFYRILRQYKI